MLSIKKMLKTLYIIALLLVTNILPITLYETIDTTLHGERAPQILKHGISLGMILENAIENYRRYAPKTKTKVFLEDLFNIKNKDFLVTKNPKIYATHLTPSIIGKTINFLYKIKTESQKTKNINMKKIKKNLINALKDDIKEIKKKNPYFDINQFIGPLFGALYESNFWGNNPEQKFPENLPIIILYTFIYKKTENRKALQEFFDHLCTDILEGTNPSTKKLWEKKEFSNQELDNIKKLADDLSFEKIAAASKKKLIQEIPQLITFGSIHPTEHQYIQVGDCFETTIHNLVNTLAYNKNNRLSIEQLKKQCSSTLTKEIDKFYKIHTQAKDTKQARQDWIDIVLQNNIPYAIYYILYNPIEHVFSDSYEETLSLYEDQPYYINNSGINRKNNFLYIPETSALIKHSKTQEHRSERYFNEIKINNATYSLFSKSDGYFGYGLEPNTHNIIIVLNHILGLNLFSNQEVEKHLLSGTFNKTYFPKLMKKINAKYEKKDGPHQKTYIIKLGPEKGFKIVIDLDTHSTIIPISARDPLTRSLFKKINKTYFNKNNPSLLPIEFFYNNLSTNQDKIEIIREILANNTNKYDEIIKNIVKEFTLYLGEWTDYDKLLNKINSKTTKDIVNKEISHIYYKKIQNLKEWSSSDLRWKDLIHQTISPDNKILDLIEKNIEPEIKKLILENGNTHIIASELSKLLKENKTAQVEAFLKRIAKEKQGQIVQILLNQKLNKQSKKLFSKLGYLKEDICPILKKIATDVFILNQVLEKN